MESPYITIKIDRLSIYAHHGVLPQERTVGNRFEVTLLLNYPAAEAVETDCLHHTLNYAEAIELIKQEMSTPSQLLEHACGRIRNVLLSRWPNILSGTVTITKVAPPVAAQTAGISVTLPF